MKTTLHSLPYVLLLVAPSLAGKASPGCGKQHAAGYHDAGGERSIISGGLNRTYGVNVPSSYNDDPNKPRKVIFDYHGNNGTPRQQWNNSQYFKYSAGEEYLAIYPAGVEEHWQSAPYAIEGVNDLQFTTDLLAHIREEYCVDDDHVYASGKSNGGGFVDFLACHENGDEFAAFAMASAALYSDLSEGACNYSRAVMESHGENDTTISYYGGQGANGQLPSIREWIGWWAERDGCVPPENFEQVQEYMGYERISYSCRGYEDVVVHYAVYDLGHCWPSSTGGNSDGARAYCYDHVLDYTPIVLDFFGKWDLRSAPHNQGWSNW